MRILISTTLLTLFLPTLANAWNDLGHRATASIALEAMPANERRAVIEVLRQHPRFAEDFAAAMPTNIADSSEDVRGNWLLGQAATWPDLIQGLGDEVKNEYNRSRWHYINRIVYLSPDDESALAGSLDHNMTTVYTAPLRQNLNSVQALRGNLQVWHDDNAASADKAIALCWILHLAGDMHQPLHNVALFSKPYFPQGDRGGNSIEVMWGDETRNLHAVWDGLASDMDDLDPSTRTEITIESDTVDDQAIDEWLRHHAQLAEMFVYPADVKAQLTRRLRNQESPTITLSHEYLVRARSVARRQLNLAGNRMAAFLSPTYLE